MAIDDIDQMPLWPDGAACDPAERPAQHAYWLGSLASRALGRDERKRLGQFMTPVAIAYHMTRRMLRDIPALGGRTIRVLDPAAGSGVLGAALVEQLVENRPARIELLLFELDPRLASGLRHTASRLGALCARRGVALDWKLCIGDFLTSTLARSETPTVDFVIANPPYFKLSGNDERARAFPNAVHGQPNIYALFMAACASLLRAHGTLCFITPRSWTNGAYFRALRRHLIDRLALDAIHVFESREEHFRDDAVLQEALILWAKASRPQGQIELSVSTGVRDLETALASNWPAEQVIGPAPELSMRLPASQDSDVLQALPARLGDLGLKASTGPVVGFRAAAHLRAAAAIDTVAMLWMPHVRRMRIDWPRRHKAEHIANNEQTEWMLLPNRPMVVMRRFSPKEDMLRITAAPYDGNLPGPVIGLENHLNVIYRPVGEMSVDEAHGLAAYLNSKAVDAAIRAHLGSTQINAAELRALPVPDSVQLSAIGHSVRNGTALDDAIERLLGIAVEAPMARHG